MLLIAMNILARLYTCLPNLIVYIKVWIENNDNNNDSY